jgi:lysylphosphatidylglycerol synthetase-like protein (DUF2156 family)
MTATQTTRRERPLGVAVIAVFLVIDALVALGQLAIDSPLMTRTNTLLEIHEWMPGVVAVVAVLRLLAAVGLWLGSRRAWVLTMLVVGVGLVFSLYIYWVGDPPYARMAIDIVIAFYLNQGAVRDYFEGQTRGAAASVMSPEPTGGEGEAADG